MQTTDNIEIESMIRWLCVNENHFTISCDNEGVSVYSACMGCKTFRLGRGPTLREAIDEMKAQLPQTDATIDHEVAKIQARLGNA